MVSIFSERPELPQQPYSFAVSAVVHGLVIGLVLVGIAAAPKVKTTLPIQRYAVRHIDLHTPEPSKQQAAKRGIQAPHPHTEAHKQTPGGNPSAQPQTLQLKAEAPLAAQTLVQPDIPKPLTLPEIPMPAVVIWDGAKTTAKTLVAPVPEKPAVAMALPSLQQPTQEQRLDDIALASTDLESKQPILPSTTSPLVLPGPVATPPASTTTTVSSAQPTHGAVASISPLQMREGDLTLAPVNQSAASNSPGALAAGLSKNPSLLGSGNSASTSGGVGRGSGPGGVGAGEDSSASGAAQGSLTGTGQGNQPTTTHIQLPIDGQFGAVVVGSSLEEKYPETAQVWSGRMAYTVYLHMGLAKSWILQYSLSREDEAAASGSILHIEAPWPYNIVRPNMPPDFINADALMVHGYVNQAGRFEGLAIVFPPQFAQAQFVMDALTQWKFRPATQDEREVKVEVLLIIPEDQD
jgi:hypothetical protein